MKRLLALGIVLSLVLLAWFTLRREPAPVATPEIPTPTVSPEPTPSATAELARPTADEAGRTELEATPTSAPALATPAATTAFKAARAAIRGRLIDDERRPVAGATISLHSVGQPWAPGEDVPLQKRGGYEMEGYALESDADGRFQVDVPVPVSDWISLDVRAGDYLGLVGRNFGVAGGRNEPPLHAGDNDLGELILPITGAVSGEVRSVDGLVIARAEVRLEGQFPGGRSVGTSTDDAGRFVLGHVPAGNVTVGVLAKGYLLQQTSGVEVRQRATTPGVAFRLEKAPILSGRVVDETGTALGGVRLWGWPVGAGQGAGAKSASDGTFTIPLPQNESYTLEVEGEEFEPWGGHGSDKTFAPGTSDIVVALKRVGRTTFVVLDATSGAPIESYALAVADRPRPNVYGGEEQWRSKPQSHPRGECTVRADPKLHQVRVVASGRADFEADVRHDEGAPGKQTIRLAAGATLLGRVTHGGKPLTGGTVKLERDPIPTDPSRPDDPEDPFDTEFRHDLSGFLGRARTSTTGDGGAFRFDDLAPGTYRVTIVGGSAAPKIVTGLKLEAGAQRDLGEVALADGAVVNCRVVLGVGQTAADVELYLDDAWTSTKHPTGSDARFSFTNVAAGPHVLHARLSERSVELDPVPFTAVAGATVELVVDASAKAPCTVHVRVTEGGKPLAGVDVTCTIHVDERGLGMRGLGTTAESGEVTGTMEGGSRVSFQVRGGEGEFVIGDSGEPVTLVAGGRVDAEVVVHRGQLVVQFDATKPLPELGMVTVTLRPAGQKGARFQSMHRSTPRSPFHMSKTPWKEHRLALGGVTPGEYEVFVDSQTQDDPARPAPWSPRHTQTIRIEEGRETVVVVPP